MNPYATPAIDPPVASVLFVDVGTTYHAYAYMEALQSGEIVVVATWYVRHRRPWLWDTLLRLDRLRGQFVVETIRGQIYAGRGAEQVLETKEKEGRIKEAAEVRGYQPVEMTAREWRTELMPEVMRMVPKPPLDPVIRFLVRKICSDADGKVALPKVQSESSDPNVHVYDAIGGGIVALSRMLKRPLRFSKALTEELLKVAMEARAGRRARRVAKELGAPTPRRRMSSSTRKDANEKRKATNKAKGSAT